MTAGERLPERRQRERDGAADLAGVRRGAHRVGGVAGKRVGPAQLLQAAPRREALDAIEERLAIGLAAKAVERVGARQADRLDGDPLRRGQQRDDALGGEVGLGAEEVVVEDGAHGAGCLRISRG